MAKRKKIFLVATITDNPDSWKLTTNKDAKGLLFSVAVGDTRLSKQDIKFLNANLRRFNELEPSLENGKPLEGGN